MATNFADLAQIKIGDVERPKSQPAGRYLAQFTGPMTQHKAAKTGNVAMRFPCKILGPGEDVDAGEYEASKGNRSDINFNLDFWMSPDARYRFTDFGKAQGASDEMGLVELAEWLIGDGNKPFLVTNTPEPSKDNPEVFYNRFDNPTAAE